MNSLLATAMFAVSMTVLTIGSASATSISFDAYPGPLGVSQFYDPVTAYGYTTTPITVNIFAEKATGNFVFPTAGRLIPTSLYGKTAGGDENGLGLTFGNDHEINAPAGSQAIVLDITALVGRDLKIGFGSVQLNEGWEVGFSNSATLPTNESAFTGYITGTTEFPALYDFGVRNSRYVIIEATSKNILLTSLSATAVPEPASMALVGVGLIGLGCVRRRAARA